MVGAIWNWNTVLPVLALAALAAGAFAASLTASRRREVANGLSQALEASEAAAAAWKEERDAAVAKADRLDEHVGKLEARLREAEATIERLQERTDLTRYFEQQREFFEAITKNQVEQTNATKSLSDSVGELAANLRPVVTTTTTKVEHQEHEGGDSK